jgi:hypothetical protein
MATGCQRCCKVQSLPQAGHEGDVVMAMGVLLLGKRFLDNAPGGNRPAQGR